MRRVARSRLEAQLRAVIDQHFEFDPDPGDCWGWGAQRVDAFEDPCTDCHIPRESSLFIPFVGVLCWRCAFWRHMASCRHREKFEALAKTA